MNLRPPDVARNRPLYFTAELFSALASWPPLSPTAERRPSKYIIALTRKTGSVIGRGVKVFYLLICTRRYGYPIIWDGCALCLCKTRKLERYHATSPSWAFSADGGTPLSMFGDTPTALLRCVEWACFKLCDGISWLVKNRTSQIRT